MNAELVNNTAKLAFSENGDDFMPSMDDLVEQGRQLEQLREQEMRQTLHDIISDVLQLRFDTPTDTYSTQLDQIYSLYTLTNLAHKAVTAESLAEFEQHLPSF